MSDRHPSLRRRGDSLREMVLENPAMHWVRTRPTHLSKRYCRERIL